MTAGFLRKGDASPNTSQRLSLRILDSSLDDENFKTSRGQVINQVRSASNLTLTSKTILEDSDLNPSSSYAVQSVWPHILTLSELVNRVSIKLKRQQ